MNSTDTAAYLPEGLDSWQELIWHLQRLPGGVDAAIPDFFGGLLRAPVLPDCWPLLGDQDLVLSGEGALFCADHRVAELPADLCLAAEAAGVPVILLGLLALAVGHVEGDRRLKAIQPKVDAAAKDLMLMTVCRLCG